MGRYDYDANGNIIRDNHNHLHPHVHIQAYDKNGKKVDPGKYLPNYKKENFNLKNGKMEKKPAPCPENEGTDRGGGLQALGPELLKQEEERRRNLRLLLNRDTYKPPTLPSQP